MDQSRCAALWPRIHVAGLIAPACKFDATFHPHLARLGDTLADEWRQRPRHAPCTHARPPTRSRCGAAPSHQEITVKWSPVGRTLLEARARPAPGRGTDPGAGRSRERGRGVACVRVPLTVVGLARCWPTAAPVVWVQRFDHLCKHLGRQLCSGDFVDVKFPA